MKCNVHGEAEATRGCTSCSETWCDACVTTVGPRQICPVCGHLVQPIDAEPIGIFAVVRDAATRVFSMEGLTTSIAFAAFYAIGRLSPAFSVLSLSALVGYYFLIVRHVGNDGAGLPGASDSVDDWTSTLGSALRGLLCAGIGFVPLAFYVLYGPVVLDHLVMVVLVVVGQLYVPAALLAVVISDNALAAAYPVAWVRLISRSPGRYLGFTAAWIASVVGAFGLFVGHYLRENRTTFGW